MTTVRAGSRVLAPLPYGAVDNYRHVRGLAEEHGCLVSEPGSRAAGAAGGGCAQGAAIG